MSVKSASISSDGRRSFMSLVTSVLTPRKKKRHFKSKQSSPPNSENVNKPSPFIYEDHPIQHLANRHDDEEPGYSTVQEVNSVVTVKQDDHLDVAQTSLKTEDLYSKVEKRQKKSLKKSGAPEIPESRINSQVSPCRITAKQRSETWIELEDSSQNDSDKMIEYSHRNKKSLPRERKRNMKNVPRKSHKGHSSRSDPDGKNASTSSLISKPQLETGTAAAHKLEEISDDKYRDKIAKIKQKHQQELLDLRNEMQLTDQENDILREKVAAFLEKELKWKEEDEKAKQHQRAHLNAVETNAELHRRITKLELDTKQEVQLLCRQIKSIQHEKEKLLKELHSSQQEHISLQKKLKQTSEDQQSMISVERHIQSIQESKKFLDDMKKQYEKSINELQKSISTAEDEKNEISIEILLLQDRQKDLQTENTELKKNLKEVNDTNKELLHQLQEMKKQRDEATNLAKYLSRTAERVIAERDAEITKNQMQEHQNEMVHMSIIQQSMNVGRLEEHMIAMRKKMNEEVRNAVNSKNNKEADFNSMKKSYESQLNLLRNKLIERNTSLDILGKEKRQLESDLQNLWEATVKQENPIHNIHNLTDRLNNR